MRTGTPASLGPATLAPRPSRHGSGCTTSEILIIIETIEAQIFLQGRRVRSGVAGVQRNRCHGGLDEITVSAYDGHPAEAHDGASGRQCGSTDHLGSPRTDNDLFSFYLEGDAEAFRELFRRHARGLFNFAYRMLRNAALPVPSANISSVPRRFVISSM